ncbi:hypothetical protein QF037_009156 [Streptomyces canus]|nr:hypothetical protein [Streptomyces canus]
MTWCAGRRGTGFACMVAGMQASLDAARSVCRRLCPRPQGYYERRTQVGKTDVRSSDASSNNCLYVIAAASGLAVQELNQP